MLDPFIGGGIRDIGSRIGKKGARNPSASDYGHKSLIFVIASHLC